MKIGLASFFITIVLSSTVYATSSTVDPNYPGSDDHIDAYGLRTQFQAAHDDIDQLFEQINLPPIGANQFLGSLIDGVPSGQSIPPCSGASQALNYTLGTGFGCRSFAAGGTVTNVTVSGDGVVDSSTPSTAVTNSGNLALTPLPQNAHSVLIGPSSGSAGATSFRPLIGNDLPLPTSSGLGGVISLTPFSHQFLVGIGTDGTPLRTQPSFGDLSGNVAVGQMDNGTSASSSTYFDGTGHWSVPPGGASWITALTGDVTASGTGSVTAALVNSATARGDIGLGSSSTPTFAGLNLSSPLPVASGGTGSSVGLASGLNGIPNVVTTTVVGFGDSIYNGHIGTSPPLDTLSLVATDIGAAAPTNYAVSGYQVCDMAYQEVFLSNTFPPALTVNPIYLSLIGTNDADHYGMGSYEAVFKACHLASLAWLAIPTTDKVMAQSAGCTTTGTWTNNSAPIANKLSSTNGSTLTCTITTSGGPIYAWYNLHDVWTGTFTYSLDNGSAVPLNSFTTPLINTFFQGSTSVGEALIRLPNVSVGTHTLKFTVTSPTGGNNFVGIIAVGSPDPLVRWRRPMVFSGGVMRHNATYFNTNAFGTDTNMDAYNQDAKDDANLLLLDGLPVYFVDVQKFVNPITELTDGTHPNQTGYNHLRDANEAAMQPNINVPSWLNANQIFGISGCSASGAVGTGTGGVFTAGITGSCTPTIAINGALPVNASHGWNCFGNDRSSQASLTTLSDTTTSANVIAATTTGDVVGFNCIPY